MTCSFSSFDGIIPEIPGISVDNFERTDCHAYFLSHCHTDHTQGLSSAGLMRHLEDNDVKIYMSDVTAAIIGGIPSYDGVKKYMKPLKLGSKTTIQLPSFSGDHYIEVTLIPASHCFGSVMFLFRTSQRTILFTGDFRMSRNDVSTYGQLHDSNGPIHIDTMYVDTTFIDCTYDEFPKRSESVEYVVQLIKDWLERDGRNAIALHPSARFGYEFVFNGIYRQLNEKIFVQEADWCIYSKCQDKVPSVTNKPTRIYKCRNRNEKNHHFPSCSVPDNKNYLFVHLSALKWTNYESDYVPYQKNSDTRVDVCFSTHCSRSELINFVSYFGPGRVVGFPNPYVVDAKEGVKVVFKGSKRKMGGGKGKRKERRVDRVV